MAEEKVKEKVRYVTSLLCWGSTSFRPLGEVVSDYYDVLVSLLCAWQWPNQINANLFPAVVGNWYRM